MTYAMCVLEDIGDDERIEQCALGEKLYRGLLEPLADEPSCTLRQSKQIVNVTCEYSNQESTHAARERECHFD